MKKKGIGVVYPAGTFDKNLTIVEGNHALHEFMGSFIYFPLYKMIHEDDLGRFEKAVENCKASGNETDEYLRMKTASDEYERFVIYMRKCENEEQLYIELFNMSKDRETITQLDKQLTIARDYLTLVGSLFSEYHIADDSFCFYWINDEQTIKLADTTLEAWKNQMLEKNWIAAEDRDIFSSLCESMKKAEDMQIHTFSGSIFTNGEHMEKYQAKFLLRDYDDEKTVLGLWTVLNETKKMEYGNYVEDSYIDSLTRLLNKKTVTEYAQQAVEGSGKQLAIAVMDIDNFKNVNDTYGHLFGDQVIRQTADVLKKVIGRHGVAGRIGGDEFMLVIENFEDEVNLRNYLRSIKQNVNLLFQDKLEGNHLSCSIGVARNDIVTGEFKELFMTADKALYLAKQKGKNRYIIYKPELHGQFNVSENSHDDMLEIRKSYYSDADITKVNKLLSDTVVYGRERFPMLLSQAAHTLMVDRLIILWNGSIECAFINPERDVAGTADSHLLADEAYLNCFQDDLYIMSNSNSLEYNQPKAYQVLRKYHVLGTMQRLLRDKNGEIKGFVSADECTAIRSFPKLAIQIFQNMCQIINAVLIRDDG